MVGDLPTAVGAHDLDRAFGRGRMQVVGSTGEPERVDRRMFGQPQLVAGSRVAAVGEGLHRGPGLAVDGRSQPAHQGFASGRVGAGNTVASIGIGQVHGTIVGVQRGFAVRACTLASHSGHVIHPFPPTHAGRCRPRAPAVRRSGPIGEHAALLP